MSEVTEDEFMRMAFEAVNKCETMDNLCQVLLLLAVDGEIQGRTRKFDANRMVDNAKQFYNDDDEVIPANVITREFGLRQQVIYLKYCRQHGI